MASRTARELLGAARKRLVSCAVDNPTLDARLLLQAAAGLDHATLAADPEISIASGAVMMFEGFIGRRCAGEPVSRILGIREFYGRDFAVTPAVLDPRPDTETVIDACLEILAGKSKPRLLDLGTGSGAIAVTLLCEIAEARATGADISAAALDVARGNAEQLGVAARFETHHGNWLDGIAGRFDLIVSNPPYIPGGAIAGLAAEVREHDPRLSLDGGPDGLEAYRRIARQVIGHLEPGGAVVVEIGAGQEAAIGAIFSGCGLLPMGSWRDLTGHVRSLAFAPAGNSTRKGH
jgi:release factor glutamine methyltransferase